MKEFPNAERLKYRKRNQVEEYTLIGDYDHVKPHIVNDDEELIKMVIENIKKTDEKWLIFIDNIDSVKCPMKK